MSEARSLVAGGVERSSSSPRTSPVGATIDAGVVGRARSRRSTRARTQPLIGLVERLRGEVDRVRLLYLYPSGLTEGLIESVLATGVPYFDLSLQHASRPLLRAMRRWGDGARFLERIAAIRAVEPHAMFRSSFILGYPGETEDDQATLLDFIEAAQLDWAGFFTFSSEEGTLRGRPRRAGRPRPRPRASARGERDPRRDHRRQARRTGGFAPATADRRARRRAQLPRVSRDRRRRARPGTGAGRRDRRVRRSGEPRCRSRGGRRMSDQRTYGPSALLTPANIMTAFRLVDRAVLHLPHHLRPDLVVDGRRRALGRRVGLLRRDRRAPARHDDLGRVPRPARRQGDRARWALRRHRLAPARAHLLRRAGDHHYACARSA